MRREQVVTDVKTRRERAQENMADGAVTGGYAADRQAIIGMLNEALATELVCVLRYERHHFMASGLNAKSAAQEFLQHANEERIHAHQIAKRIVQIGGEPNFSPEGLLGRSRSGYVEGSTLMEMIEENLIAERVAIDSYREMITYLGNGDTTTRRMLEEILAMEEEHANDLAGLIKELGS